MVGAPRFELGTPSPPDRGGFQKSLDNFANGHPFGRPAANGLALVLQTVRTAKCSNSVAIGVESECGAVALGRTYLLPPLSSGGALVVQP